MFLGAMLQHIGFPVIFPFLQSLLGGLSVGYAFQYLLNASAASGRTSDMRQLLHVEEFSDQEIAQNRLLLYLVIGDPAFVPFHDSTTCSNFRYTL